MKQTTAKSQWDSLRHGKRSSAALAPAALLLAAIASLPGCGAISDSFAVDSLYLKPKPERKGVLRIDRIEPVNLEKLRVLGQNKKKWYVEAAKSEDMRNRLQAYLVRYSNRICELHKAAIVGHRAAFNLVAGVLNVGAGAAGTLVSGGSSQLLSAVSAMISGTQATVNVEVYQKFLGPAITKRIDIDREEVRKEIISNRAKLISVYTVDDAILDVQRYHLKCSFYSGLSSLVEEGAKSPEEQTSIAKLIEVEQKKVAALNAEITALEKSKTKIAKDENKKAEAAAISTEIAAKQSTVTFLNNRIRALRRMLGG